MVANLVEEGVAQIKRSADGESELRLSTGEVYRLNRIPCGGLPE